MMQYNQPLVKSENAKKKHKRSRMIWPVGSEEWKQHQVDGMYEETKQNKEVRYLHSCSRARHKDAKLEEKKTGNQLSKDKEGRARPFSNSQHRARQRS